MHGACACTIHALTGGKEYFTFRPAFITPGQAYPRPREGDRVFFAPGPARGKPDEIAAVKVIWEHNLHKLPLIERIVLAKMNSDEKWPGARHFLPSSVVSVTIK